MLKLAILAALVACAFGAYGGNSVTQTTKSVNNDEPDDFHCTVGNNGLGVSHCFSQTCIDAITDQVNRELNAAFKYLYMAAHFDDNRIARLGMAKFLYESASEERQHAILMINYLNNRGIAYEKSINFTAADVDTIKTSKTFTLEAALEMALGLEIEVTNHIYNVVKKCDTDYHGADFFTEPILAEQYEGMRKLQGALKAFTDLKGGSGNSAQNEALAEFIFDQKMIAEGL